MKVRIGAPNSKLLKKTKSGKWRTKDSKTGTSCHKKYQV